MEIDLQKLEHILTVAELRNFSKAADRLRISQPALSRSVASTERRFGVTIFERGRGGVRLTHQGKAIVEEADMLMRRARDLEHNLLLYGRGEGGGIRFGMAPLIASLMLPKLGPLLLSGRPGMSMQVDIKPPVDLLADVRSDTIEMAIVPAFSVQNEQDLSVETLCDMQLSVLVRSGHPLKQKSDLVLSDIFQYPVACGSEIEMPERHNGLILCSNFHIMRDMVLRSDIVWFSSDLMLEGGGKGLERLPLPDFPKASSEAVVVRRSHRRASPAMAFLIKLASQHFS